MSSVIKLSSQSSGEFLEIPVLYRDEHLLALSKPPGMAVSATSSDPQGMNLSRLLHGAIQENKASVRGLGYLMNAFRIDDDASGVVLFARSKEILQKLADHFGSSAPGIRFVILCRNRPAEMQFEVDVKLAPDPLRAGAMRVDSKHGKKSITRFAVLELFSRWALLQGEPNSLRPHQVRAHLRQAGYPAVGDSLYGGRQLLLSTLKTDYRLKAGREERPLLNRAALLAETLSLIHPVTGEPLTITAPMAKDMAVALKYLRRFAAVDPGLTSPVLTPLPESEDPTDLEA